MSDFLWTLEFFYRKLKQFCSILQEVRFKPETARCMNAASVFSPPPRSVQSFETNSVDVGGLESWIRSGYLSQHLENELLIIETLFRLLRWMS